MKTTGVGPGGLPQRVPARRIHDVGDECVLERDDFVDGLGWLWSANQELEARLRLKNGGAVSVGSPAANSQGLPFHHEFQLGRAPSRSREADHVEDVLDDSDVHRICAVDGGGVDQLCGRGRSGLRHWSLGHGEIGRPASGLLLGGRCDGGRRGRSPINGVGTGLKEFSSQEASDGRQRHLVPRIRLWGRRRLGMLGRGFGGQHKSIIIRFLLDNSLRVTAGPGLAHELSEISHDGDE